MTKSKSSKQYLRSLQDYEWRADVMPKKSIRKWKKKERQRGKKEIRDERAE